MLIILIVSIVTLILSSLLAVLAVSIISLILSSLLAVLIVPSVLVAPLTGAPRALVSEVISLGLIVASVVGTVKRSSLTEATCIAEIGASPLSRVLLPGVILIIEALILVRLIVAALIIVLTLVIARPVESTLISMKRVISATGLIWTILLSKVVKAPLAVVILLVHLVILWLRGTVGLEWLKTFTTIVAILVSLAAIIGLLCLVVRIIRLWLSRLPPVVVWIPLILIEVLIGRPTPLASGVLLRRMGVVRVRGRVPGALSSPGTLRHNLLGLVVH